MTCLLYAAAKTSPNKIGFICDSIRLSYGELFRRSLVIEDLLSSYPEGSVIACYNITGIEFFLLFFAARRKKLILFPLNKYLPTQSIEYYKHLALDCIDSHFMRQVDYSKNVAYSPKPLNPRLPITWLLTSGSTSNPKICQTSFRAHYYSALGSNIHIPLHGKDIWLLNLPLYHVSGISIVMRSVLAKTCIAYFSEKMPLPQQIVTSSATHISCIPSQIPQLNTHLPSLKYVLIGGAPMPPSIPDTLPYMTSYGLTETSSQLATSSLKHNHLNLLPYREMRIGGDGEIFVKGAMLFDGYIEGDTLSKPFDSEGWFATRDIGYIEDNALVIKGRKDSLFISGGENIQPEEIERHLLQYLGIKRAIVVAKQSEQYGAIPVAYIDPFFSSEKLISLTNALEKLLPKFKIPKAFYKLSQDIPEGKLGRKVLSEMIRIQSIE